MPPEKLQSDRTVPPIFLYDEKIRQNYSIVTGLDEAGRGPLAGPVVAAAVIFPSGLVIQGLRDSKKTPERERKRLFWEIIRGANAVGVGIIDADTIDKINILRATRLAMKRAIEDLGASPDFLLIDAVKLTEINVPQESLIKGESISASIAAASIVAKVVRDDLMHDYHYTYPQYNFQSHKGYSTSEHVKCIGQHGPCPIHRKSFRKVMDVQLPLGYQ